VPLAIYILVEVTWAVILARIIIIHVLIRRFYLLASYAVFATVFGGIGRLLSKLTGLISPVMRALSTF
jgi:ascorbate-specific PTS system EIIC-type component UlaA